MIERPPCSGMKMKIKEIQYPEGVQLKGWNKLVFERRIKRTLGSFFSVCELDRCRVAVLSQERDDDLYAELDVFHCDSFKNMGKAEAQALVEKTGEYVGVSITAKHTNRAPNVAAAMVGGIMIGAVCALIIPAMSSVGSAKVTPSYVRPPLDLSRPSPVGPLVLDANVSVEPIFSTTVHTNQPAATARTLASAVRSDVGEYDVSLTVTPTQSARLK